jgi:hypothetical protein
MDQISHTAERKSAELKAFGYWLRTGRFAPGRGTLPPRSSHSPQSATSASHRPRVRETADERAISQNRNELGGPAIPSEKPARLIPAQHRPTPRTGISGNGGPRLNDPLTLDRVFSGASTKPSGISSLPGSIIAMADNILDITGPGARLTEQLAVDHTNLLIRQIRQIDPNFEHASLGFPRTLDGQINMIRDLRIKRALAFYRVKGELRPMQVEVLRHLQEQTDRTYDKSVTLFNSGRLRVRLSREEAIGNFVDREVRKSLRNLFNQYGMSVSQDGPFRIIGREYISSGSDRTFRVPDARSGEIAFDVTLARKTMKTPQVRGFFSADFHPQAVVIVRPSQLGSGSTYRISKPGK